MALLHLFSIFLSSQWTGSRGGRVSVLRLKKIGPKTVYLCSSSTPWDAVSTTHLNNGFFGSIKHSAGISAHCRRWDYSREPERCVQPCSSITAQWKWCLEEYLRPPKSGLSSQKQYWTVLDHWTFGFSLIWILRLKQCFRFVFLESCGATISGNIYGKYILMIAALFIKGLMRETQLICFTITGPHQTEWDNQEVKHFSVQLSFQN